MFDAVTNNITARRTSSKKHTYLGTSTQPRQPLRGPPILAPGPILAPLPPAGARGDHSTENRHPTRSLNLRNRNIEPAPRSSPSSTIWHLLNLHHVGPAHRTIQTLRLPVSLSRLPNPGAPRPCTPQSGLLTTAKPNGRRPQNLFIARESFPMGHSLQLQYTKTPSRRSPAFSRGCLVQYIHPQYLFPKRRAFAHALTSGTACRMVAGF
jgi:hypothetical protein